MIPVLVVLTYLAVIAYIGSVAYRKSKANTDDFFLVVRGHLTIQLRDRDVELDEGELFVVPRGVEHRPKADEETHVLLIEPKGTRNTGNVETSLTAREVEL